MPVIVVEGMDNTGKSTLCDRLFRTGKSVMTRSPGPQSEVALKNYYHTMVELAERTHFAGFNFIFDRMSLVSEEVYGRVLRGDSIFGKDWGKLWDDFIQTLDPTFVYCRPPRARVLHTLNQNPQMEGVVLRGEKLLNRYDYFFTITEEIEDLILKGRLYNYNWVDDPDASILMEELLKGGLLTAW